VKLVVISCVAACGGARVAPVAPPTTRPIPEVAAPSPDAAPVTGSDCIDTSTVDGPTLAGARATIEICTTAEHEIHGGMGKVYERRAKLVARPSGAELDLGEYREEHDEYGGTWGFSFDGVLGNGVLVERVQAYTVTLHAYVLANGVWVDGLEFLSGQGVAVQVIDATHATVTPCIYQRQTMSGLPDGPCVPDRPFSIYWTGSTIEPGP
jgi:hypothetical protein